MKRRAMRPMVSAVLPVCLMASAFCLPSASFASEGAPAAGAAGAAAKPSVPGAEKAAAAKLKAAALNEFVAADPNLRLPGDMRLTVEWYTPPVGKEAGRIIHAWVRGPQILAETDRHVLISVKRKTGTEMWRCELSGPLVFEPAVSRENVVVNIANTLVALSRRWGKVRWRLQPRFLMSGAPVVIDPVKFPGSYPKKWTDLEKIYLGSATGSFEALVVRARMREYARRRFRMAALLAPEFQLMPLWRKPHRGTAVVFGVKYAEGHFCYLTMDRRIRGVDRNGEAKGEYAFQGLPSTPVTVQMVAGSPYGYVGSSDNSLYAINLFTCGKIWNYPLGETPVGHVAADAPRTPYVYVTSSPSGLTALKIERRRKLRGDGVKRNVRGEIVRVLKNEDVSLAWKFASGRGVAAFAPEVVYVGEDNVADEAFRGYRKLAAVAKETGKLLWRTGGEHLDFFLEFHNDWSVPGEDTRVYAVTNDGRFVSYKRKVVFGSPVVEKGAEKAAPAGPAPASLLEEKTKKAPPAGAPAPENLLAE